MAPGHSEIPAGGYPAGSPHGSRFVKEPYIQPAVAVGRTVGFESGFGGLALPLALLTALIAGGAGSRHVGPSATSRPSMTVVDSLQSDRLDADLPATGGEQPDVAGRGRGRADGLESARPEGHAQNVPDPAGSAVLGALAVWFLVFSFVLTDLQEHGAQARLSRSVPLAAAGGGDRSARGASPGRLPGGHHRRAVGPHLQSGRRRGHHVPARLTDGPGHLSDTPLPGQMGTSVIFGRSVTYGAPFDAITGMQEGTA